MDKSLIIIRDLTDMMIREREESKLTIKHFQNHASNLENQSISDHKTIQDLQNQVTDLENDATIRINNRAKIKEALLGDKNIVTSTESMVKRINDLKSRLDEKDKKK